MDQQSDAMLDQGGELRCKDICWWKHQKGFVSIHDAFLSIVLESLEIVTSN